MVPLIAALLCGLGIWALYRFDWEPDANKSIALWVPMLWLFFSSSRNVSEWFHLSGGGISDAYTEGSPLDRAVFTVILALGVVILYFRRQRVAILLRQNIPIVLYFLYCGISVIWSDFADVAFKRWFRACGDVVMVLIILSEPDWFAALKRVTGRLGLLLIPLSVLFIRYFPALGRQYTRGGRPTWTGVTTDKNALGMVCLIFGLAAVFRFLTVYRRDKSRSRTRQLIAQGVLVLMTCYLLREADSATAQACFGLACTVLVLTFTMRFARRPVVMYIMVFAAIGIAFSALFLGLGTSMVQDLGRDTTLTGRTAIWNNALPMVRNPILGTGFESFWVGPRLREMMVKIDQGVNQAHNGYIEVYLNLGWVGVMLLAGLIFTGFGRAFKAARAQVQVGSLRLAYCMVAVVYNFTEAGFKTMNPVWIMFLFSIAIVPGARVLQRPKIKARIGVQQTSTDPLEMTENPVGSDNAAPDYALPLKRLTDS